jgi:hypothetical protein
MRWSLVEKCVRALEPDAEQNALLSVLIAALASVAPPREVTKNPYDGAICLHWDGYEIATFGDRFETYQFNDRSSLIHHWPHSSWSTIKDELIAEATKASA